jgi:hypothetical protein
MKALNDIGRSERVFFAIIAVVFLWDIISAAHVGIVLNAHFIFNIIMLAMCLFLAIHKGK